MCCVLFHFSRSETEHTKEVVKPYDWTYTTDYKGTLLGDTATLKVSIFPLLHAVYLLFQPNTEHFFFFLDLSVCFYKFCMVLSFWLQSMPWAFHVSHRVLSIKSQLIKKNFRFGGLVFFCCCLVFVFATVIPHISVTRPTLDFILQWGWSCQLLITVYRLLATKQVICITSLGLCWLQITTVTLESNLQHKSKLSCWPLFFGQQKCMSTCRAEHGKALGTWFLWEGFIEIWGLQLARNANCVENCLQPRRPQLHVKHEGIFEYFQIQLAAEGYKTCNQMTVCLELSILDSCFAQCFLLESLASVLTLPLGILDVFSVGLWELFPSES